MTSFCQGQRRSRMEIRQDVSEQGAESRTFCHRKWDRAGGDNRGEQQDNKASKKYAKDERDRDPFFRPDSPFVHFPDERLSLAEWHVRHQAGGVGNRRNGLGCDLEVKPMVPCQIENGKDWQFRAGSFVHIGLFKSARIELLKTKQFRWCLGQEQFALVAFPFQGKEIIDSFAASSSGAAIVLVEQAKVVTHRFFESSNMQ